MLRQRSIIIFLFFWLYKIAIADSDFESDKDLSWSVFPFVIYNSDFGFGFGGKGVIKNIYSRDESFDLILFGSTKGEQWYAFTFSIPDFELRQGKPYPFSLDFKIEYNKRLKSNFFGFGNDSEDNEWQFPRENIQAEFILGHAFTRRFIAETGMVFSFISVYNYQNINPLMTKEIPGEGQTTWNYLTIRSRYDSRDSQIHPRVGMRINANVDFSFKSMGSEASYQRYRIETSSYHRFLLPDLIIALRLWFQHVNENPPYFQQSALGGSWTLRGYKVERFIDKTMLLSSAETRFPIFNRLGGVLFVDFGRTYNSIENISLASLKANWGVGLRYYLRNFVTRFDTGISSEGVRLFFHFGHVF
jgi:outer membrane protein assembly factor BamA